MAEKTDMERIGLFKEMPYITINDPYHPPMQTSMDRGLTKGRQILSEGIKSKAATDDGFFLKPFVRIFEGEAESNIVKIRRQWRLTNNKGFKPFIPSFGGRMQSGVGSRMGCMDENMPYFSAVTRAVPEKEKEKRNIYTSPGRKGTGYGYLDVCLNPYPTAGLSDSYERAKDMYYRKDMEQHKTKSLDRPEFIPTNGYGGFFDPNPYIDTSVQIYKDRKVRVPIIIQKRAFIPSSYPKFLGGCKCGGLNPYPESMKASYKDKELRHIVHDIRNNTGKLYVPVPGSKSCIYQSILRKNVDFRVNNLNSHLVKRVMNY